jgi:hypothetical protein
MLLINLSNYLNYYSIIRFIIPKINSINKNCETG